jgi:hypothetical protein
MNNNNQTVSIKSWNTNQKKNAMPSYVISGTEQSGVSIACIQEFSPGKNPECGHMRKANNTNNIYYMINNDIIVGIFSYNMGLSSPSKNAPRVEKYELHGTLIIWDPKIFDFFGTINLTYTKLSSEELGNRSTPIVTLCTKNLKFLNIVNVHAHAKNKRKKITLFSSIFNQLKDCNIPTIIVGDYNYKPHELEELVPQNFTFNHFNGITHINAETNETFCIDHIVHNKLVAVTNLKVIGIDQKSQTMNFGMKSNNHDHGILSFQATF